MGLWLGACSPSGEGGATPAPGLGGAAGESAGAAGEPSDEPAPEPADTTDEPSEPPGASTDDPPDPVGSLDAGAGLDAGSPASADAGADAGSGADAGPFIPDPYVLRLQGLSSRLAALAERTMEFWIEHGPDSTFGGFYATLDRAGNPVAPDNKGLVQQARYLWTLATWYERRDPSPAIEALAQRQYEFLSEHFVDAADGAFVLTVSRDGTRVVDGRKQMYAESFALYALATYGRVFDVPEAIELALARFESIDITRHDPVYGGYDQRNDPGFKSAGAEKDTNTHLHLMEAYTALYEATGDALVGERLEELTELIADTLRQDADYVHSEFLLDWTPFGAPVVSYGHDLETSWLLLEAGRVLGRSNDAGLRASAYLIAETSATGGFDATRGGFFEVGVPGGAATDFDKVWWVQFEALAGLWWDYAIGGVPARLDQLEATLGWIEASEDSPIGEWFATTNADGSASGSSNKADEYKESYHPVRSLVFVQDWIDAEAALRA
ncbi:MAG TPA: AGE family epimerase/isomerase, partial [Polyangiaceae bacterium]|nr:AGE family epimerase/isomerase [Polyangiaceae bacterium]